LNRQRTVESTIVDFWYVGGGFMKRYSRQAGFILTVVMLAPLLLAACGKTVGDTIDDATVTTRVKTALLNDPEVGGLRIDVDTFKGVVTLSGRVKTKEEEAKAIALARRIGGVTDVKSTLQIQP
jgi:hyperosmotically inducible periplasmic protein